MSSSELQALFSNLRPRSSQDRNSASPAPAHSSRQASSTLFTNTRVPASPPPPFSTTADDAHPANMSQPGATASTATAQNLLNLLNFGHTRNATTSQSSGLPGSAVDVSSQQHSTSKSLSASDLVARIMSPPAGSTSFSSTPQPTTAAVDQQLPSAVQNPLLELLNRQASAQESSVAQPQFEEDPADDKTDDVPPGEESIVESIEPKEDLVRVGEPAPAQKPLFTYKNPFDALNASRSQTPIKSVAHAEPSTFKFSASPAPESAGPALDTAATILARKKLTPKLRSQRSGTSPLPDHSPVLNNTIISATPVPEMDLSLRQKQPMVETPGTAFAKEIPVSVAKKQATKPPVNDQTADAQNFEGQEGSGEWEDEDDSPEKSVIERIVPVFNFPIKAFVSITLQLGAASDVGIRDGGVVEISRLKKEFDQLDRSLAAATSKYITYAIVKHGGLRIIRQDDGKDLQVFKYTQDRIFNVSVCTTATTGPPSDMQAVLGTGISGAVYYATVSKQGNDLFERNQLESESLIFPPWPHADENTAGGVLKTRAKRSSRHPEYFAIGRGKSIHIIWPATVMSPRYGISDTNRKVDVEKLYQDRPLQIQTGKAGKDFTFSEDDTMIVSLDKTGRLRFWDIRQLVDEENATSPRMTPQTIDTPILSLSTASPAEKSWPTSVLFVDKARPYNKGGALRYVLVGLRQNHTLQLWDIALGKAVQELNFPHDNETDGICSVSYHPASSIIVVGHPTRNSIFFVHLSAPRYTLSSQLSQAAFVTRVANKDPELPKPDSTACMSGIREISLAAKGELRSVELLPVQKAGDASKSGDSMKATDEQATLFELYVFHSKGVSCLNINKEDLGWNGENKVVHPVDAQQENLVALKELKLGSVIEESGRGKSPSKEPQPSAKSAKKKIKKATQSVEETVNEIGDIEQPLTAPEIPPPPAPEPVSIPQESVVPKEPKKGKKKPAQATEQVPNNIQVRTASPVKAPASETNGKLSGGISELSDKPPTETNTTAASLSNEWVEKKLARFESIVSGEFKKEFESLQRGISNDRAAQDQTSLSRQEEILRLVSSSLSTNVEKSLSGIIADQFQKTILPGLVKAAADSVVDSVGKTLDKVVVRELDAKLSKALSTTLQTPQMTRSISDAVNQKLVKHLETQVADLLVKTVTPVFKSIAQTAVEQATADVEARLGSQMQQLQVQHTADNEKVDKLSQAMQSMAETLRAMSDSQVAFQSQILRDRQQLSSAGASSTAGVSRQVSTARASPSTTVVARPTPIKIKSKAEVEFDEITEMMAAGRYEEGTIKWLQSSQPAQLFDDIFVRFTPEYLASDVSPLVAFSVAVTIANSLDTNVERRLEWISAAFDAVDPLVSVITARMRAIADVTQDPELTDLTHHAPQLISSIISKLESLYMTLAENSQGDPVLRAIPALAKKARDMKAMFATKGNTSGFGQLTLA